MTNLNQLKKVRLGHWTLALSLSLIIERQSFKKSKTYAGVFQSRQPQGYSSYGENVMNWELIKKYLLYSSNSSIISTFPHALSANTSSPENSSACKYNILSLECSQDREHLDISEKLQNHQMCFSDIRTSGTGHPRLREIFCLDTAFDLSNRI